MRKTTGLTETSEIIKSGLLSLPPVSTSVTVRIPNDLVMYMNALIEDGDAKDKTEALIQCIRRHRETRAGILDLRAMGDAQRDLAAQVQGLSDAIKDLGDDAKTQAVMTQKDFGVIKHNVNVLIQTTLGGQ